MSDMSGIELSDRVTRAFRPGALPQAIMNDAVGVFWPENRDQLLRVRWFLKFGDNPKGAELEEDHDPMILRGELGNCFPLLIVTFDFGEATAPVARCDMRIDVRTFAEAGGKSQIRD